MLWSVLFSSWFWKLFAILKCGLQCDDCMSDWIGPFYGIRVCDFVISWLIIPTLRCRAAS